MAVQATEQPYAARLQVDYPDRELDRVSSFFRIIWVIPIIVILVLISGSAGGGTYSTETGEAARTGGLGVAGGFAVATVLMILFRQKYPRWWFDFLRELTRFEGRVTAYLALMNDQYPSTDEEQTVHIELDYPDATQLNRWLPLVKWLLAIPHYIVLFILGILAFLAVIGAWFAILLTGKYPQGLFNFIVGVGRWGLRVQAYAFLLLTDKYPPFSME